MSTRRSLIAALKWFGVCAVMVFGVFVRTDAHAFSVTVVDDSGKPISAGFRWTLEEDNTFHATPGVATPTPGVPESHTISVNIHRSHAPVLDTGRSASATAQINVPSSKRYFLTVLPDHTSPDGTPPNAQAGWTQSGRGIDIGQNSVTIMVHRFEPGKQIPTAQMTVLVFEDNDPINAAYDMPAEHGLAGFKLLLTDPSGLPLNQDAWANPLGTTYLYAHSNQIVNSVGQTVTIPTDAAGNPLLPEQQPEYQLDGDGLPIIDYKGEGILLSCPGDTKPYNTYTPYEMANCIDPYSGEPMGTGEAVIRYQNANKYTVEPIPPGNDPNWFLTGTLEGTRGNDVWLRAGEPRYNISLGQLNWLVFYGFVKECNVGQACGSNTVPTIAPGTHTIDGRIVFSHDSHPPLSPGLSPGLPVPDCYVGLNNLSGADEQIYTGACNSDSTFSIANVPPGTYQLAVWDLPIDVIIDYRTITVTTTDVHMGDVSVFGWFGHVIGSIFNDKLNDENGLGKTGFRDDPVLEPGIPGMLVNLRYSDGSIYQSSTTDSAGNFTFNEVFPWWRFITMEVDFSSFHIPGVTAVVDDGGPLDSAAAQQIYPGTGTTYASMGINPQIQPDGKPYRTQLGEVITNNYLPHADMTARMDFAKVDYPPPGSVPRKDGENTVNGGISGVVYYATTRTEEDPQNGVADPWEPGIPRVQFNLYQALHDDGSLDPGQKPIKTAYSDSFDDNNPTGCVGQSGTFWASPQVVNGVPIKDCAETFRTWEQIRPGTFDGAWAFVDIPAGKYVVEMVPPKGYSTLFWGDRNIEFGDPKLPFLIPPAPCVGPPAEVPPFHTLFPDQQVPTDFPGFATGVTTAPQCNRKLIDVADGKNATTDFYLFTYAPKAARIWGAVFNDLLLEFNPNSPNAGGNFTPSWLPVSLQDFTGTEVARAYTDQWGHFDALVPSNYDIAPPIPLGLALSIITIQPNDAGPIDPKTMRKCDVTTPPGTKCIVDPFFNPAYSQEVIRENWEFYPGKTTFVDTIVLPVSGFTANAIPLNCDFVDATPEIQLVSGPVGGPVVSQTGQDRITIRSLGVIDVPNPDYNPNLPVTASNPRTITREHGFGATPGSVTVGGVPLIGLEWTAGAIRATVPAGVKTGQLVVTRGDNGLSSTVGVTLHVVADPTAVVHIHPPAPDCQALACSTIQPVINAAHNGDLIIIDPGTYQEHVVMWKPVQLQGWGAPVTIFDGVLAEGNLTLKDHQFTVELLGRIATGEITSVPGQDVGGFVLERGAGIAVAGCDPTTACTAGNGNIFANYPSLIDGISMFGATEAAGGLLVNGYADKLRISNNEIYNNQGNIAGGIRLGTSSLNDPVANPTGSSFNPDIRIDHNRIADNGSLLSGAGGIAIYGGSDRYQVTNNMVCGNFSAVYGGGIGHFGLSVARLNPLSTDVILRQVPDYATANSQPNVIANNIIVSNESFDEAGGIMIGSEPAATGTLSTGAGPVLVNANLIQGNKSGNDGGGVRTLKANGQDVADNPSTPVNWFEIDILNNLIVNNSSADVGGGIALDDTARAFIINNTVANNDSTSTGSDAFGPCDVTAEPPGQFCPPNPEAVSFGGLVTSVPQVAGISSSAHSAQLQAAFGAGFVQTFSNPALVNDIIWHNRTFYWDATINGGLGGLLPFTSAGAPSPYWDLAVTGTPAPVTMSPTYSILTDGVGATPNATNIIGADPLFVKEYFNVYQATSAGAALGNFVTTTFTPTGLAGKNGLYGDYHIKPQLSPVSPAVDAGTVTGTWSAFVNTLLKSDYDGNPRPLLGSTSVPAGLGADIGADEVLALVPHIQVAPLALGFGSVPLLQPMQLVLTVRNLGQVPLILSDILNFTGTDAAMFKVVSTDWSGVQPVPPNGTAHITVVFKPTSIGAKAATLNIVTNDPITQTSAIAVTGTGI